MASKDMVVDISKEMSPANLWVSSIDAGTRSALDLIRCSREKPPTPIIEGLLNAGDILLLHGGEESFKSFFVLQLAEAVAKGKPLLNRWKTPTARTVGVIETEMNEAMLGARLKRMFPKEDPPQNLRFMGENALRDWKRLNLIKKLEAVEKWTKDNGVEVLMIDTANDFFRGSDSPSDERKVGGFFDELRTLDIAVKVIVRHNRKQRGESANSNEQIRGSAEWKEDPEAIICLKRCDRRTNEVTLEVGKMRYGKKPDPLSLWFDNGNFRLTALPPIIEILSAGCSITREKIVAEAAERFGLCERRVASMIAEQGQLLAEKQFGHSKAYEINLDNIEKAPWCSILLG